MFCAQCGTQLATEVGVCSQCGFQAPPSSARWSASTVGNEVQRQMAATSRDAATALRLLVSDPVGGLPAAHEALGSIRARSVGIALCAFFSLAAALGLRTAAGRSFGGILQLDSLGSNGALLKWLLLLLVPPAVLAGACYAIRRLLSSPQRDSSEVFIAGAALAPAAIALLLSGLLGIGNVEIVFLLFLLAFCYLVLILYSGLTAISGVSARVAAPAVPVLLVLTGWLTKVVAVALW